MFILLLIIVLLCAYKIFVQRRSRKCRLLSKYPGEEPFPIVGNGFQLGLDTEKSSEKLLELWKRHGMQNCRLTVGTEEWLMVTNPDDVATILNHPKELTKQVERNSAMKPLFGNSISTSDGERWKFTRKLMAPCFHFKTLQKHIDIGNSECDRLFKYWDKKNSEVDIYQYLKPFTFDVVCLSSFGINLNLLDSDDYSYFKASDQVMNIITDNYFSYWRRIRCLFIFTKIYRDMINVTNVLNNMSKYIITHKKEKIQKYMEHADRIDELKDSDFDETSLLDRLLLSRIYSGIPFSEEMIMEEINLICWTGHHSPSLSISHALYCIAKYPEVQEKVLEEQRLIFKKEMFKKPTYTELTEMKYLEVVIKESIRFIPTITIISRHLKEDLQFKDGRVAPADTTLMIFYKAMYQDPKLFSEPEKFMPERFFLPMHNYAFVPFSAGPRNCLAFRHAWMLMKSTISNIIRRYELSPGTEPQFVSRLMTESNNGLHLKIKKRIYK